MRIVLKISYVGTQYKGWQVQKNACTLQEVMQNSIEAVYGKRYPLTGCGRTDSGVHANEYYCMMDTDFETAPFPVERIPRALNRCLPNDISVSSAKVVAKDFHVRYNVKYKEYEYLIWNLPSKNPFYVKRAWHCSPPLHLERMQMAANLFLGTHDFAAFMTPHTKITETIRTIVSFDVCKNQPQEGFIRIRVRADGFLYHMVRILVGTLVFVSDGRMEPEEIPAILESKNRKNAGMTAPAYGLYLNKVIF